MASFRDRFFTRRVAEAITSPSAILLAGAGTAAGIVAGVTIPVAAAVGAAAYAVRVALAIPRAPKSAVDLSQLSDPWRTFVADAIDACNRYQRALGSASSGPLRERLAEIGDRLNSGVDESWRIAQRGMALESALDHLDDPSVIRARLEMAKRGGAADLQLAKSLQAQLESTERITGVAAEARHRLQLLDARLDEAVARAVELALSADDARAVGGLGTDVDAVVADMEALRQALEETHRPGSAVSLEQ
ncbi:MAG: hypothetical protein GEU74_07090 [Nitriliruptorales bacterium]|nr:hypothetical protein [Nitriliruptorales bacterium]